MITLRQAVIVEGKYDKIKLSSILDAVIIPTDGFGIFKDKEKMNLIRRLAEERGLLILTDSDGAGFVIRNYLSGCIPAAQIRHVYIPDILGKEKRKDKASKEGKLGVEGIPKELLIEALQKAGVTWDEIPYQRPKEGRDITNLDLYEDGITGTEGSKSRRLKLLSMLSLPEHLSTKSLLQMLNTFLTYKQYKEAIDQLDRQQGDEEKQ
ncbi:DUF4093 domain-containing protein [[Clostridium] leptum]|nr:DUF4093 domain-containing protein [[Clostridium] leptum]